MSICSVPLKVLNLFTLQRLFLLADSPAKCALEVADRLVGLHAKRPQVPYLSLHARIPHFQPSQLNAALYDQRTLLRVHGQRGTVHLVSLSQYGTILAATAGQLDGVYRRAFQHLAKKGHIEDSVISLLEETGPLSHANIANYLHLKMDGRDLHRLLNELCTRQLLVKTTVNGSWRSNLYNYDLLRRWQPRAVPSELDPEAARAKLLEWYLAAYAPATVADVVWWTGFSRVEVDDALSRIKRPLSFIFFKGLGVRAYIFTDELRRLETWTPPRGPHVNLLPAYDPYVVAYSARHRYIRRENYSAVFRSVSGIINPVVLLDGHIVGVWSNSTSKSNLSLKLFESLGSAAATKLEEVTRRMAIFIAGADAMGAVAPQAETR